ncbi:MAG: DUF3768 domain-containing protein [Marinibacterium sp.]
MTTQDLSGLVGAYPVCGACKATAVLRDAWAIWNRMTGSWELQAIFNEAHCEACGGNTMLAWEVDEGYQTKRIRCLNDAFRRGDVQQGTVVITEGIRTIGDDALPRIMTTIAAFDNFSEDNDPRGEHDFGAFDCQDERIFWKIDYFDRELKYHSPDAANPEVTCRVLTVTLAREY